MVIYCYANKKIAVSNYGHDVFVHRFSPISQIINYGAYNTPTLVISFYISNTRIEYFNNIIYYFAYNSNDY